MLSIVAEALSLLVSPGLDACLGALAFRGLMIRLGSFYLEIVHVVPWHAKFVNGGHSQILGHRGGMSCRTQAVEWKLEVSSHGIEA